MKKTLSFFVVTIVATTLLLSCKKNDTPAPITITGYWTGTFNNSSPIGIIFYKYGRLKSYNLNFGDTTALTGQAGGTYTFSDSTVLLTFDFIGMMRTLHLTGKCKTNKEGTLLTGNCFDDVESYPIKLNKN